MYVLILSRGYPRPDNKVLGIFEMDQAKALQKLGVKVVFFSIDLRSIRRWRKWGYEKKTIDGIDVYGMNIPLGRVKDTLLDKASAFSVNYLFKKVLKEKGKPDILHGHFVNHGYMGVLLKEKYGIPLVITEHSSELNRDIISKLFLEKGNKTYKKADKLITVSPALKARIKDNFGVDSIYIPNIVDTDIFTYRKREREKLFRFISTGHLIPIKDNETTIKAFHMAFAENPHVVLEIFGEGNSRKNIETLIQNLDLKERVILRGQCSREEIAKTYNMSDVFVLSSKSETFGVSYIEALASGLPVLATRCGGPESFVDVENGLFSEVGDVDKVSQNMKYIYENIENFNRKNISINIVKKFSAEIIGANLIKIYESLL